MTALFANRFLTPLRAKAAAILRFVVILVLVPALCGGCASSARLGAPLPAATGKYRMAEMLPALSNDYWEINPEHRAGFIAEQFPKGMPDDFVSIEGSGAQADIQALRLDPCTLAIVSGTQRHMRFADGDHQIGFTIEILRRTDDGWQDLTPAVFPFWSVMSTGRPRRSSASMGSGLGRWSDPVGFCFRFDATMQRTDCHMRST